MKQYLTVTKGWPKYRDWILTKGVEYVKRPYVRCFKWRKKSWSLTNQELLNFPTGSLGQILGRFLLQKEISLVDKLEDHDVMHVLFELDTTVKDEAIMQWILLGNGKRTIFCMISVALSWLLLPDERDELQEAYRHGKGLCTFHHWRFEFLLREPLPIIRAMINKDFGELEAPFLW